MERLTHLIFITEIEARNWACVINLQIWVGDVSVAIGKRRDEVGKLFNENCTQQSASSNSAMGRFDWFGAAAPPLSFTTDPIRAETEAPVAFDVDAYH